MFAVESLVVNGYAYMLARKFAENPDKESARAVFKASLWYLPVMLSLMVFHSKNWKNDEPETPAIITSAKQTLKTACPHEAIYGAEQQQPETIEAGVAGAERSSSSAAFCPIPGKIKYEEK